jgi:hypothetical protein
MAKSLKPGAIVVTFTKGLNLPKHFEILERKRYKMSWGPATVFIHRRLGADGLPIGAFKLNILPSDEKSYSDDEEYAERQKRFESEDDEEEDEDEYEDDYESEEDDEDGGDEDEGGDEDDEEDENSSADEEDDGDDEEDGSDSSGGYGLGNEQHKNPYAPQRSYYASNTSSGTRPLPAPIHPSVYGGGSNLHVKVNPLTSEFIPTFPFLLLLLTHLPLTRSSKFRWIASRSRQPSRCGLVAKKESFCGPTPSWGWPLTSPLSLQGVDHKSNLLIFIMRCLAQFISLVQSGRVQGMGRWELVE